MRKTKVSKQLRAVRMAGVMLAAMTVLATSVAHAQTNAARPPLVNQTAPPGFQNIQHVIVLIQENRSPDNLFHGLKGADIATYGIDSKGNKITLTSTPLLEGFGLGHAHWDWRAEYDNGKMDGADLVNVKCYFKCPPPPNPQFRFVRKRDVAPYFALAKQYVFADRMFQTNQGASFPSHQFLISGTSAPTEDSDLFVADNPLGDPGALEDTGCTAPPEQFVKLIDRFAQESAKTYPCFEHSTLMDLLDGAGLSWRYYAPKPNQIWTGPNAISHIRLGSDWQYVILNPAQVLTDIGSGQLANVSWVVPRGSASDHPTSGNLGPSWVTSVVNAVGNSPYWANTAIFVTWDDWGGWYEHVAPPIVKVGSHDWGAGYAYGFRVPLLVISSYAKSGYVSHVTHDFGSILRFTEEAFNLPSLGFADAYADDLSDCFNFNQQPRPFRKISAPYDANFFINDKTPPEDPDDE